MTGSVGMELSLDWIVQQIADEGIDVYTEEVQVVSHAGERSSFQVLRGGG
jgi:hypothetical protein